MNFFEHQEQARRKTGRLVLLFIVAVVMILVAVNVATFFILTIASPHERYARDAAPVLREDVRYPGTLGEVEPRWRNPFTYVAVSLGTLLIIGGGSAYKTAALSSGGHAVASLLGGRPLDPASAQGQDRVLQNVVEEMSIASGVPVPAVYVMENEDGINAFAAGFTTEDAVVGVTRGCVEKLNRDELQGVVAHEFSHILNGDMRLNVRLIGILHGILVIAMIGYGILRFLPYSTTGRRRSSDRNGGGNAVIVIALAGAAMIVIGYIGVLFGRLIQAAVSRQREYLADASAVQFTRNPRGLAGALAKIAAYSESSRVRDHHAVETAHLFFANFRGGGGFTSLLATHPPIMDRIKRIDPTFDGRLPEVERVVHAAPAPEPARAPHPVAAATSGFAARLPRSSSAEAIERARAALDPGSVIVRAGSPTPASIAWADRVLETIPSEIIEAAHDSFTARAVVFSLLLSEQPRAREAQLAALGSLDEPALHREVLRLADAIDALGSAARLPLLDLALPALRAMSSAQIARFRKIAKVLAEADRQITLFEYALLKVLDQSLRPPESPARREPIKYYATAGVRDDAAVLLTSLAVAGQGELGAQAAFAAGVRRLELDQPPGFAQRADLLSVDAALFRLQHASPAVKQRVIDACAHTVAVDGQVTVREAELLRAIASAMDVPLPPLLATAEAASELSVA